MLVTSCNYQSGEGGSSNTIEKVKPPIPPKPKWALQPASSSSSTDLQTKVGSDSRSGSRPQYDFTSEQIVVAATMPAAGILKKSSSSSSSRPGPPPPPPPIVIRSTASLATSVANNKNNSAKSYVPPKPKRFLSRATEPNLTNRIQFEEEEPKTEDSYDYKDIDLAAEIFDFTPFPPRPKPPRKRPPPPPPPTILQNGVITNEDTIVNGAMITAEVAEESKLQILNEDILVEQVPLEIAEEKKVQNGVVVSQPNPQLNIEQELLELERDRWEIYGTDDISVDEEAKHEVGDGEVGDKINSIAGTNLAKFLKEHEGYPLSLEDVQRLEKLLDEAEEEELEQQQQLESEDKLRLPSVRFGAAEILEGMTDDEDRLTGDYSDVEFHREEEIMVPNGVPKSTVFLNSDNGTYEPIGPPDMRFMRPDLSNYKPPVPSTIVEDPFSWRRQGRRRYCSYGYDNQGIYISNNTSAVDKIMEGCQELEDRIVARDLSPPGTLLDTLGGGEKHRQKRVLLPPTRPPPPVPPKVGTLSSTSDNVVSDGEKTTDEDAVLAKLESEIVVSEDLDKFQVNGTSSTDELVTIAIPSESHEVKEMEEVMCKSKALNETGNDVETAASVFEFIDDDKDVLSSDVNMSVIIEKDNGSQTSKTSVKEMLLIERPSRRDAFEKGWRPQRPPPPKPQRPVRHKRFRSADPLPTRSETEIVNIHPQLNNKPKRSESFHTAEDVRRRIDIQAQQFLRTPRKKDFLSPTYVSSSSFSYSTLGRPRSPFPVYSLVNKNMSRKKLTTTSSMTELSRSISPLDGRESLTPPIPPPIISQHEDNLDVGMENLGAVIDPLVEKFNEWAAKKRLETFTDEDEDVAARKWENNSKKSPTQEPISSKESIYPSDSSTPATRPLPAPPAPPRHKTPKINEKEDSITLPSGISVVFCGVLPKGDGGHMAVVPELKVMRLTVGQLDASILRVSQVEAGVLRANRIEDSQSHGPPAGSLDHGRPSSGSGGEGGSSEQQNDVDGNSASPGGQTKSRSESQLLTGDKVCDAEGNYLSESAEGSITDACPTVISVAEQDDRTCGSYNIQHTNNDQQPMINALVESKHFIDWVDSSCLSQDTTDTEKFVSVSSGNHRDSWSCDRDGRESPLNTVTSTTSESASYVTCDETLHDGMGLTDGLDDDPIDLEVDIDFVLNDDNDGVATGCPTPTELEMDITLGDDMNDCVVPDVMPRTFSNSVFYTDADEPAGSLIGAHSDKSNSSNVSSTIEGIAKLKKTKGGGCQVANGTTSWYVEDGVLDKITDTSESEHHDSQLALVSSGLSAKSYGIESNGCDVAGGTLIHRIAELHDVSRSHSNSTQNTNLLEDKTRISQCRHSKFYVLHSEEQTMTRNDTTPVMSSNSEMEEEEEEKNSCFRDINSHSSTEVVVEHADCLERQHLESSSEDEDQESDASSPRNLSTYSDVPAVDVDEACEQNSQRSRAFYIAREFMTSEKVFVDVLNLLTKDFPSAIEKANEALGHPIIPNEFFVQILDCLPQLRSLNEDLLKDLEARIEKWNEIGMISDVIVCKGPFLKLYTVYIKKFPVLTHNLEEACRRYPQFAQTVRDFELSDRCKKLELKHYMLKPVQRIPQYRMLLKDYLKHIDSDCPDYANTEAALMIVSEVASHANETMKEGDKFAKLMQIQSRISGNHEILKPGRTFIKEGELLKLCRKEMQPRLFILFSDSLLHLSTVSQGLLRIHHELPLSNMKVSVPTQEDFQNEFSVISVTRSFTLSASSPEERDEWISELSSAIRQTVSRHASFVQAKLHQLNIPEFRNKSETLGQQAPVWIPDSRVTMCQLCVHEFTLTFRRHHCRACGKVVCSVCSANRAPLFYLNYETARVCDECFAVLHKEIEDRVSGVETQEDSEEQSASNGREVENFTSGQKARKVSLIDLKAQFKKYYRHSENQRHKRQLPKVLKEVCANDAGSSMSGYLYKKVKRTWKRQWFVIKDKVLYTYRASEDVAALDSTPLLGFHVVTFTEPRDGIHQQLLFELRHPGYPSMEFYAESMKSAKRWLKAVEEATILQ